MGRRTIPPNQRAQPISFSLKPHLIAKIDEYCTDHRFNRSKFLMQAVTEYMTRHIVHGTDLSSDVNDMSLDRRVAVGLAALQEANREKLTVKKGVMDALRREMKMNKDLEDEERINEFMDTFGNKRPELTIAKLRAGEHTVSLDEGLYASIEKDPQVKTLPWMVLTDIYASPPSGLPRLESKSFETYREAVRYVRYHWG